MVLFGDILNSELKRFLNGIGHMRYEERDSSRTRNWKD